MNTRLLAARALRGVVSESRSLTAVLEDILPTIPRALDRAFVQSLSFGVLRWYWQLDWILSRLAAKPIRDDEIRMLALLGLYQLIHSRVKPHAAVAETVAAAERKQWAKPLLNALLRSWQRRQDALRLEMQSSYAAVYSHPDWLLEAIKRDWPEQYTVVLDAANQPPPMALRVNRLKTGRDAYLALLREAGIAAQACARVESAIILAQPAPVEQLPRFDAGWVSVQDGAAQLAASLLAVEPGMRVLDACAAPGGKTLHLLESCPDIDLLAIDHAPERLRRVEQNLQRAGLDAQARAGDASDPAAWWDGKAFDRILLDAPCSATGVIRRHSDIKMLRQPEDIPQLIQVQRQMLGALWPLLKPGGILVYSTCSILRSENERQTSAFLNEHPEASEVAIRADWGEAVSCGRQILTGADGMDGFYYARLTR
ncbi:16S rRNA (cytosine(967)-C(5))-methyltransferase RsmB [Candidatus Methylospira mobilis]|uniref:16S rRNA (cytosine(967)-C(5))-methyltransferase RsmB n=1 Tax=Candidatus Methylospira mobilis TaxID=1808979 RepID=UPI0028F08FFB|nr:16S rRNA (cytosine(967)-C(5))-methyltransferase RsmB [Candidatus Methylospira mobilis]WNV06230.1 16S rRNA (cytosine(967)-C(5))-methyltransferase RsmB [Candidatus Methylospira mobilis]